MIDLDLIDWDVLEAQKVLYIDNDDMTCPHGLAYGELLKVVFALRDENKRLNCADMIWDADDPEQPFESVNELIHDRYDGECPEWIEVQRAISLPNQMLKLSHRDEHGDYVFEEVDRQQVLAARGVGLFARYYMRRNVNFITDVTMWTRRLFENEILACRAVALWARKMDHAIRWSKIEGEIFHG